MKKIILSAASLAVAAVASVSVAPTTSEAIPAFARQTGSACLACHFQSFPTLAAYGRAFKMGGMTDSARDLVEDEHLSIPATLNWTVMVRPNWVSSDNGAGTTSKGFEFADQVFMIGGRGGEHTGVFVEYDGAYANAQMINSYDMGDLKAGWTVWNAGFGEDAGMQVMSVWGQHGGMLGGKSLSINNQMGTDQSQGIAVWAGNDTWVAQLGFVDTVGDNNETRDLNGNGDGTANLGGEWKYAPVLRGNYFLNAGDWEVGLGAIIATGSAGQDIVTGTTLDTKRTGIDVQAFGDMGDMQIGIFADWATAPASGTTLNYYNQSSTTDARTGYSFRVSVKPVAQWIFLAGIGQDKVGAAKTDRTRVGVEYEMYQNFAVQLIYDTKKVGGVTAKTTLIDLELLI